MKKSLLALAALTAFAGAASAQSSVTMYGRVDLSIGKASGSDAKFLANGSGSRLGMRGVEDLGGGMKAIFNIEHRFAADTGNAQNMNVAGLTPTGTGAASVANNRFWGGRSLVGLQGGFGEVALGREYTVAFLQNQLLGDPWGWDTVASNDGITSLGGIAKVRNDSSLTYRFAAGGFGFQFQIAEATDSINSFASKPTNFSLRYGAGPLLLSYGYEKTGREAAGDEKMSSFLVGYDFGAFRPTFWYGKGDALSGADHKGWLLGLTAPMGQGELRFAYGDLKANNNSVRKQTSLGYHYALSKRSTIYVDVMSNSRAATSKSGYDVGLKHNF